MNGEPASDDTVVAAPDGRFAIVGRSRIVAALGPVTLEDWPASMARVLSTLTWLTEAEMRDELSRAGLDAKVIDAHFTRARAQLAVFSSQPTVMERITRIGYRNADGQEVIRRTDDTRDGQRLFVMRCSVCAHEYGAYGCDADIRRCPACQDGPPGIPTG